MSIPPPREDFQPPTHWAPTTPARRLLYAARLLVDLQTNSYERDLRPLLAGVHGKLLDVGCGNSPFRHLLNPATAQYQGVDSPDAVHFGYHNPDAIHYDGHVLPFPDASFDAVLCTEVLEHVLDPVPSIREMHRVLKPGGLLIVTVPWSARIHYHPYDYHRFSRSMLELLFADFSSRTVKPRGTDLSSIASKVVVVYARNVLALRPRTAAGWLAWPLRLLGAVLGFPLLAIALPLGHAGIHWGIGSRDDPLGHTVIARK